MTFSRKVALLGLVLLAGLSVACFFPGYGPNPYGYNPYDTTSYAVKLVPEKAKKGDVVEVHISPAAEDLYITYMGGALPSQSKDGGKVHTFKVPSFMSSGELVLVIGQKMVKCKITITN